MILRDMDNHVLTRYG